MSNRRDHVKTCVFLKGRKLSWKPLASFSFTSLAKIMSHFHVLVKITHWEGKGLTQLLKPVMILPLTQGGGWMPDQNQVPSSEGRKEVTERRDMTM